MVEPMFSFDSKSPVAVGQVVEVTGTEAKHAISVRRMRVGESIQLGNGQGKRIKGLVASINNNCLGITVTSVIQEERPKIEVTLVQALAKGDRDELAIQAATELGAMRIIPWQSERSVSRWIGLKEAKAVERWQTIVNEAAKQSLRAWNPQVSFPISSEDFKKIIAEHDLVLVLDPTASVGLGAIDVSVGAKIALVVGPEGGISDDELASLHDAGAQLVHLGAPILRTSTAGVAALAAILAKTGQWN